MGIYPTGLMQYFHCFAAQIVPDLASGSFFTLAAVERVHAGVQVRPGRLMLLQVGDSVTRGDK